MVYTIVWSARALKDYEAIRRYWEKRDPDGVGRVMASIADGVKNLATFPFVGNLESRMGRRESRETFSGSYRIYFDVTKTSEKVLIRRIWHTSRRDPNSTR